MRSHAGNAVTGLKIFSWGATLLLLAVFGLVAAFLLAQGVPGLGWVLFFGQTPPLAAVLHGAPVFDGLWPACLGTLALVGLASALAIPLGVASGVYLAEYAGGRTRDWLACGVDLLAGVPSILMGLFGFALILLLRKTVAPDANTGLLLSSVCLALLVLPYLVSATRLSLEELPVGLRLTAASLGLSHGQQVSRILLPAATRGIFSGAILAVGRVSEDTAVILLTGVVANAGVPASIVGHYEALPFFIYYRAAEYQTPDELQQAFSAALVLLGLTGLLLLAARHMQTQLEASWHNGRRHR